MARESRAAELSVVYDRAVSKLTQEEFEAIKEKLLEDW
jgi:hypothetical protein